jgi:nitroreductase
MVFMNTLEAIKTRCSERGYLDKDVPDDVIEGIMKAAVCAPSAGNTQDWHFVVVKNAKTRKELAEACIGQDFVAEAPVVICVCSDLEKIGRAYGERGKSLYSVQDTSAAIMCLMLAAWENGLGTCWVGAFSEQGVKNVLVLPASTRPMAIVTLGYPKSPMKAPKSRNLKSVLHKEHW